MEELGFDNILGENEIDNLFVSPEEDVTEDPNEEEKETDDVSAKEEKDNTTEVIDPESLFGEENQRA